FTGSFDSAYRVETTSTYEPPMAGVKEGSAIIEARWLGPCKADQKPGDMILSNGMKFNIHDAQGRLPERAPGSTPPPGMPAAPATSAAPGAPAAPAAPKE